MDGKLIISVVTLIFSILAAYMANEARENTLIFEEQQAEANRSLDLLSRVFDNLAAKKNDKKNEATVCIFVEVLAHHEEYHQKHSPLFVREFINKIEEAKLWSSNCLLQLEGIRNKSISPKSTSINEPVIPKNTSIKWANSTSQKIIKIGKWHAVIASYNISTTGCEFAKKDVESFSKRLSNKLNKTYYIYIVRTKLSKNYAVIVDAGDDRENAKKISEIIKMNSDPNDSGSDSFVQGNREWEIDSECSYAEIILK